MEKEKVSDIQEDTEGAKSFHLLSVGFAPIGSRPTLLRGSLEAVFASPPINILS